MRTSIVVSALLISGSVRAEHLERDGDLDRYTFESMDPGEAHASANVFAREIGNILKRAFPSKVLNPTVTLHVFSRNGKKTFRLTWTCRVVPAMSVEANYYFDRRGTLLPGATIVDAKRKVETEIKRSGKVSAMRRAFKGAKTPDNFIRDSTSGSSAEGFWYIKEFFLVAPQ